MTYATTASADAEHPRIAPITDEERPLWSVMIPTYQCAGYLADALTSVLAQAHPSPQMQIEVVDDCSEDNPESVVQQLGQERVAFYRQPHNMGIAANLTTCISRSRGHLVHLLHGDDVVLPGFYNAYSSFFGAHPEALMAFSRAIVIDERGERNGPVGTNLGHTQLLKDALVGLIDTITVVTPTAVVRRTAYEMVGGFNSTLSHATDWEMWMRIASRGPIGYLHGPHLLYRWHAASDSSRAVREARNIDEYVRAVALGIRLAPPEMHRTLQRRARRRNADAAEYHRRRLHEGGEHRAALRHAVRELRLRPFGPGAIRVIASALRALGSPG